MNRQEIYRQIQKEYENERSKNALIDEQNRQELYKRLPEIKETDEQIRQLGLSLIKLAVRHAPKAEIDEVNRRIRQLSQKKAITAKNHGITLPEPVYTCPKCKDTGYIGSKKCSCMKKKLIEKYYAASNLSHMLKYENFSNFNLKCYSDEPYPGEELSPRKNIKTILEDVYSLINSEDKYFNLYFYGNSGLGKTFMCSCIAKYMLDKGSSVIYMTAYALTSLLEKNRFRPDEAQDTAESADMLFSCDLLIIDDLGTESITSITAAEIFNIINSRLINRKSTVISSNMSTAEIGTIYSDRVRSRILGNYKICYFYGSDIRRT